MTRHQISPVSIPCWHARLYAAGATPAYDDPEWECDHPHSTIELATACAAEESARRSFTSSYARGIYRPDLETIQLRALKSLDGKFAFTELELVRAGAPDSVVADICTRLFQAFIDGSNQCDLDHYPETDSR
jgi:hypothetical protein